MDAILQYFCVFVMTISFGIGITSMQCNIALENDRYDCLPEDGATQQKCVLRGCCWAIAKTPGAPYCFYPSDSPGYRVVKSASTAFGETYMLNLGSKTSWPDNVMTLQLDVRFETKSRLHFKIYDPFRRRYEVPISTPKVSTKAADMDYAIKIHPYPFGITVSRKSSGAVIFNSNVSAPLIFANQFLQIASELSSPYLYGLGEHQGTFLKNISWAQMAFWARDVPPMNDVNLYGDHPFYLNIEKDGQAHGVFLLNSNAMSVSLQPTPSIIYRTTGGILDFYIFLGPSPQDVVQQYTDVIGKPYLPPYWSLGFHLCRWGYNSSNMTRTVIERMRRGKFPYDVQWNDIDYMRDHLDWTYDPKQYGDLPGIVQDLHAHGQHYVMIVDPGISNQQPKGTYPPYEDGLAQQVFIMNDKGNAPLEGVVWPGKTVYPDFTNPATQDYWFYQASLFHQRVAFDGLWTDMNEPSDFVAGSTTGCEANNLTNPPYVPKILDGKLAAKTICPGAQQNLSIHYNLHSMYGHFEVIATQKALQKIRKKRSLVITRSSFPGTGHFGGHWSGDNQALWSHLYYSIPFILNFQMFGISQVGSDICGFIGETTEELCTRWMQVGAFYPFMRNHNTIGTKDQDPAVFSSGAQDAMREALVIRYTLLPYLNTLFYHSHIEGTGVVQPLMYMYPKDTQTYAIDKQFMWGSGLMISPVLDQGQTEVRAYFPDDTWYDYYTGEPVPGGHTILLSAPLEKINLHIRGATIIPTQPPAGATTTTYARMQPFSLIVALIEVGYANGDLYWDDGESLDAVENGKYTYITFQGSLRPNQIKSTVVKAGYAPSAGMTLGSVKVMGVPAPPGDVTINGVKAMFKYNENAKMLDITNLNWDLMKPFTIIFN